MRNTRLDNCIAFIGRKNSGKTTLVEALISELTARGISVSSIKHHSHDDFEIDIPARILIAIMQQVPLLPLSVARNALRS